jgi:tRNA pseudouridine55 synthase
MDGILNINKPAGETSFSIVARIRRLSGERRAGHAGTLDPTATGVLPVCLGKGTRIIEFLVDTPKKYLAEIELGVTTDTYDGSGQVIHRGDPGDIDREQLETTIDRFRGKIRQIPPMYSAVKYHGQPLYKLARAGVEVERKSRPVTIHRLELLDWQTPLITAEIECSKGTYIRTLAYDLGEALGCGAYLKSLVRTGCGGFDIKDSVTMPELEEAFRRGYWEHYVHPVDIALHHQRAIVVNETTEELIKKGRPVTIDDSSERERGERPRTEYCRAYSADGRFLAVLESLPGGNVWQPKKVLV